MQNREELRQKGPMGGKKRGVATGGKNIIFRKGAGINIVFGPKYRPLYTVEFRRITDIFTVQHVRYSQALLLCSFSPLWSIFIRSMSVQIWTRSPTENWNKPESLVVHTDIRRLAPKKYIYFFVDVGRNTLENTPLSSSPTRASVTHGKYNFENRRAKIKGRL
jgi:hypothetical protein